MLTRKLFPLLVTGVLLLGAGCSSPTPKHQTNPANESGAQVNQGATGSGTSAGTKLLATSSDGTFVLRGTGVCQGTYNISAPRRDTDTNAKLYDLIHPITPEDSDLGMVAIQTAEEYDSGPMGENFTVAFRTTDSVIEYALTTIPGSDCLVTISPE